MTEDGGRQQLHPNNSQPSAVASATGRPLSSPTQPLAGSMHQHPQQHSPTVSGHQRMSSAAAARLPQAVTAQQRLNIRSMLATTFHREGVRGLYHGIGPTLVGIVPYAGLKFYVYQVRRLPSFSTSKLPISDAHASSCPSPSSPDHLCVQHGAPRFSVLVLPCLSPEYNPIINSC